MLHSTISSIEWVHRKEYNTYWRCFLENSTIKWTTSKRKLGTIFDQVLRPVIIQFQLDCQAPGLGRRCTKVVGFIADEIGLEIVLFA